jgi:uracil-DNA glycosylase family 4
MSMSLFPDGSLGDLSLSTSKDLNLAALAKKAAVCTACSLSSSRTCSVFSSGPSSSKVVLLGEAPGANEDASGRPFCGASGRLLDEILDQVGLPRSSVYVCNAIKCRPPQNRPPTPLEIATCRPFLVEQLDTINPVLIITLGSSALRALGVEFKSLSSLRGKILSHEGRSILPTVHPAYVLRRRNIERPGFVKDLTLAAEIINS